jgi:hypothetical protein
MSEYSTTITILQQVILFIQHLRSYQAATQFSWRAVTLQVWNYFTELKTITDELKPNTGVEELTNNAYGGNM